MARGGNWDTPQWRQTNSPSDIYWDDDSRLYSETRTCGHLVSSRAIHLPWYSSRYIKGHGLCCKSPVWSGWRCLPFGPEEKSTHYSCCGQLEPESEFHNCARCISRNMDITISKSSTVKDLAQSFNDRLTTLIAGISDVILVFDTYKPDPTHRKRKLERDDKEKLLYSIRLPMIRTPNTSHWHCFCHMKKQKQNWQTTLPKQPSITKTHFS